MTTAPRYTAPRFTGTPARLRWALVRGGYGRPARRYLMARTLDGTMHVAEARLVAYEAGVGLGALYLPPPSRRERAAAWWWRWRH